eukprot:TRINITY_DN129_c0_g3_i2.p1 TRINITY_DN129_c0_g3~~TRINITY_DN129_c0_g3_i2.p1  ORF type:complete len:401 (+),score=44.94 TRINITY_DN129_c0_g3_i2:79-1281(+)
MKQYYVASVLLFVWIPVIMGLNNGLARTPQMGWNSWYKWLCNVNETVVRDAADQLVNSGLASLGYVYVNVDDCWAWKRDSNGVVIADPESFPSGMQALADYVHSKGLLFGLYSDAGHHTCAGRPGSLGYEAIDAKTYASWGVDYLKYDNCNASLTDSPQDRYFTMKEALNATGTPILFSMCEWGVASPWTWAQDIGNSWRTDSDIGYGFDSTIRALDNQIGLSPYAGPGGWNDPDMLQVGLTYAEQRSQFALWCLLKAPLLISEIPPESLPILSSKELIAVSQDTLGVQGDLIYQLGPVQIWSGPLSDGSRVVVMFNRHTDYSDYNETITVDFSALGYPDGTTAVVRDLFASYDVGTFNGNFSASVPPHDVFAGKITPTQMKPSYVNWRPVPKKVYRVDM